MQQQLITELADENGMIEFDQPSINTQVSIRDEAFQMFEDEDHRLFFRTDDMPQGTFFEAIPTHEGVSKEMVSDISTETMTQLDPATPATQPDVPNKPSRITVRHD